jgi:hypothetical protein
MDDEAPTVVWRKERHGIGGNHRPLGFMGMDADGSHDEASTAAGFL